ncbi:unnamed protein product [Bursaphelenchus xylophilus]|uniref:glutaminase n=1 Tax=Bursaphelenchus xylophilus TaxID=6326 RepID=A0A1I7S3Q8_BURXY|nr:unnamed protein product [Bursaphelenchus xylophilus]CAG9116469.1 unnamed protein product [Bursaphelenchus xylophilus]
MFSKYGDQLAKKFSHATLEQYSPIMDPNRKKSLAQLVDMTQISLSNAFECNEQSPEDLIYNMFKIPNKNEASIGKLLMVLKNYGLWETDPQLRPMMTKIWKIEKEKEERTCEARDPKHWKLSKEEFISCISESISLISKTLQNDLVVPSWNSFTRIVADIFETCKAVTDGKVADYIPQLSRVDPNLFGLSICTIDGQRVSYGDSKHAFCIQSVSKAFNYAIAASELGADYVHKFVGQEPSGRLFNEICLDPQNKPHNPLINNGAIIVTSLIQNKLNISDRFDHMMKQYRKLAGGEYIGFNNAVFLSERSTGSRNMALAYFMEENKCFPPETTNVMEALDFYFYLCSVEVTCESAAVMAATLANGGVCPTTGERCIGSRPIRDLLSLMSSCGMYDGSGQFAFHVGLPAKSGVSGVLLVVVPNVMGIAVWSPPLNKQGNSVRGLAFCHELIQRFNFHTYDSLVNNESCKYDPRHRGSDLEKNQVVSLLFAAKAGDLNKIRRMYMQGCDLEMKDYDKRTALHLAASEGHPDIILFLLNIAKVKVDPRDRWNRTPLEDAQAGNHLACIKLLEKAMRLKESKALERSLFSQPEESMDKIESSGSSIPSSDASEAGDEEDEEGSSSSDSAYMSKDRVTQ